MKKYFFIVAAALLALSSCTKVQETGSLDREVGFQVANYAQTKADGNDAANETAAANHVEFPKDESFTAYAWHTSPEGATTHRFSNQRVAYNRNAGVWTTVGNTYYWMKTGYDDFVCYAPYLEGSPEVTPNSITWGMSEPYYQVKMDGKDLMYADKALKQTGSNPGATTATPVPVLFHHALAKLSFQVKANFLEYTNPDNQQDKTTWEITLRSAKLSGIRDKGTLALTLPANSTDGKWTLPTQKVTWTEGEQTKSLDAHVWTPDANSVLEPIELVPASQDGKAFVVTEEAQPLYVGADGKAQSFYVLPQVLGASDPQNKDFAQQLTLDIHIKTTLPTEDEQGNPRTFEEDYEATLDLKDVSSLKAWQMNQNILYTIKIKPTANDTTPDTPTDVLVTFDPAVAGWEPVTGDVNVQL